MTGIRDIDNIYLASGYTDLRKAADGLASIVKYDMMLDPFTHNLYIFCNRRKTTIKVLEWDGNGFWLHVKKLAGKDRYRWPKCPEEASSMIIDRRQLEWLLDGLDVHQKHAHHDIRAVITG